MRASSFLCGLETIATVCMRFPVYAVFSVKDQRKRPGGAAIRHALDLSSPVKQKLPVAFGAGNRRRNCAYDTPPQRPHALGNLLDCESMCRRVAYDATLPHFLSPRFEL